MKDKVSAIRAANRVFPAAVAELCVVPKINT